MNRLSNILYSHRSIPPKVQRWGYSCSTPTQRFPCLVRHAGDSRLCRSTLSRVLYRCKLFSTTAIIQQPTKEAESSEGPQPTKRKKTRSPAVKNSLRRVAVEAQRSRDGIVIGGMPGLEDRSNTKTITAYCVAEQYDLTHVTRILKARGYELDPCKTALFPQVLHFEMPVPKITSPTGTDIEAHTGDVFVFPSGTLVAWAVPESDVSMLALQTLLPAAENPHQDQLETEHLEYLEDPTKANSSIKGDTVVLGTKTQQLKDDYHISDGTGDADSVTNGVDPVVDTSTRRSVDTVLAKIAFSSGLARSTKLAVLESLLSNYFESTRSIPTMLSRGARIPFTRSFILQKTGQLLSVRAQLNLYSELTDSLPDLFWDSKHELGLEGYYDQVGRALDVGIRIKVLNEKMNYAQEIASVLREQLSEKHGLHLEWIIILLIAVEVGFEIRHVLKERDEKLAKAESISTI